MKLFTNKKGDADTAILTGKIYFFIIGLFIILLVASIYFFAAIKHGESYVPISDNLKQQLVVERLTNICFVKGNISTPSYHQDIIEIDTFEKQYVEDCFQGKNLPQINIYLESLDNNFTTKELKLYQGKLKHEQTRYVLVRNLQGDLHPAFLKVDI